MDYGGSRLKSGRRHRHRDSGDQLPASSLNLQCYWRGTPVFGCSSPWALKLYLH